MPNLKTVSIGFRVTPEFKRLLDIASRHEHRSMTNLLEKLLADYCRIAGLTLEGAISDTSSATAPPRRVPRKRSHSLQRVKPGQQT